MLSGRATDQAAAVFVFTVTVHIHIARAAALAGEVGNAGRTCRSPRIKSWATSWPRSDSIRPPACQDRSPRRRALRAPRRGNRLLHIQQRGRALGPARERGAGKCSRAVSRVRPRAAAPDVCHLYQGVWVTGDKKPGLCCGGRAKTPPPPRRCAPMDTASAPNARAVLGTASTRAWLT